MTWVRLMIVYLDNNTWVGLQVQSAEYTGFGLDRLFIT